MLVIIEPMDDFTADCERIQDILAALHFLLFHLKFQPLHISEKCTLPKNLRAKIGRNLHKQRSKRRMSLEKMHTPFGPVRGR